MIAAQRTPTASDAIWELQYLIARHYPQATFVVAPGEDDTQAIHLWVTVDIDDPDEVTDLVIDRVLAFQIDDGLPVHVIPVRGARRQDRPLDVRSSRV